MSEANKKKGGTITKSVGEHYYAYIVELIESGRYCNIAEVLRSALRLHEHQTRKNQVEISPLEAELKIQKLKAALELCKTMFIANDLELPHTFDVIDGAKE